MSEDATQQLLMARVDRLISMVEPIGGQLDNLEKQVNERLDRLEKQQAALTAKLESLEVKVDQRLRETRPIWENVQSQLRDLDARGARLEADLAQHRAETASGFRGGDRKIGVLSKNLVDMTADIQELRDLIEKLESQPA